MKRFRFRLEALLTVKTRNHQEAEQALALARRNLIEAISSLGELDARLALGITSEEPQMAVTEAAFLGRLRLQRRQQAETVQQLQRDVQEANRAMLNAKREEEVVLNLKDKQYRKWRREALKYNQRFLDDLGYRQGLS